MGHWGQGRGSQGTLTATATEAAAHHPWRSGFWLPRLPLWSMGCPHPPHTLNPAHVLCAKCPTAGSPWQEKGCRVKYLFMLLASPSKGHCWKTSAKNNWTDPRSVFFPSKPPKATQPFQRERAKMVPSARSLCPTPTHAACRKHGEGKVPVGQQDTGAHTWPGRGSLVCPVYPLTLKKPMMPTPYSTQYLSSSSRFQASRLTYLRMFS